MFGKITAGAAAIVLVAGVTTWATDGAGAAPQSGNESFTLVETNSSEHGTVIMHGAFTDGGIDITKNQHDRVRLSHGAFTIYHPDSDSNVSFRFDPKTCYFSLKGTGSYTLGDGSQAYRNLTGSGTYRLDGQGVAARDANGNCDPNAEPTTYIDVIHAHGPVSLDGSQES